MYLFYGIYLILDDIVLNLVSNLNKFIEFVVMDKRVCILIREIEKIKCCVNVIEYILIFEIMEDIKVV